MSYMTFINPLKMKLISIILALFICNTLTAQYSNFSKGFKIGYTNGYCYSNSPGILCSPPVLIPLSPLPVYPESNESWKDGYNRGFIMGIERRRTDDIGTTNKNSQPITKFNPYIPQNPYSLLTPEQLIAYNQGIPNRSQNIVSGIGALAGLIYLIASNRDPDSKYRRQTERNEKLLEKEKRRNLRKYPAVSMEMFQKYSAKRKKWTIIASSAVLGAGITFLQGIITENKYNNSTNSLEARKLRNTGNTYYSISAGLLGISGASILKFGNMNKKMKRSKPLYIK